VVSGRAAVAAGVCSQLAMVADSHTLGCMRALQVLLWFQAPQQLPLVYAASCYGSRINHIHSTLCLHCWCIAGAVAVSCPQQLLLVYAARWSAS
jgi:hypothetical protein